MERIGWAAAPNDPEDIRTIRGQVFQTLGYNAEDPRAISETQALVRKDLQKQYVDPTLLDPALGIAARHGDAALFDAYLARVRSPQDPEDYVRHIIALADFRQPALIQRALQFGLSPEFRSQDAFYLFGSLLQTPNSRALAWDFIRQHWAEVEAKVTPFMAGFLVYSTGAFCDPTAAQQVKTFFTEHKVPTATATKLGEAVQRINACVDFKSQQSATVAAWLKEQEGKTHRGE